MSNQITGLRSSTEKTDAYKFPETYKSASHKMNINLKTMARALTTKITFHSRKYTAIMSWCATQSAVN